jgi:hypothetical protein
MAGLTQKMEFERLWRETPEGDKLKLVAEYAFESSQCIAEFKTQQIDHEKRIVDIENGHKTQAGLAGGVTGATVSALLVGVYLFLKTIGIIKP